jgi:chromosome segregation ATPase
MRIHSITIKNFRGVLDRTTLFTTHGVTVIVGPNEIGKSSIPEGFEALLSTAHDSKAKEINRLKPVDRDVGPEVEADISLGDYRFVYRKRWLKNAETVLTITEPTHRQLTGRDAHDKVRELLDQNLDRPLFDALRFVQGTAVSQHGVVGSSSLMKALDLASSAESAEPDAGNSLLQAIETEFDRYFTTRGAPRSDWSALTTNLQEARAALKSAEAKLAVVGQLGDEFTDVSQRIANAEVRLLEARGERESFLPAQQAISDIERRLQDAQRAVELSNEKHQKSARDAETRKHLITTLDAETQRTVTLREQATTDASDVDALGDEASGLREDVETLKSQYDDAKAAVEVARREVGRRGANVAVGLLGNRVREFDEAAERRISATRTIEENSFITPKARKTLDEALSRVRSAEAVRKASQPSLRIEALRPLTYQVDGEAFSLEESESGKWSVDGSIRILLEDTALIEVSAPTDLDASDELTAAQIHLRTTVEKLGLDSEDPKGEFEERFERVTTANYDLKTADRQQSAALNDLTPEKLKAKLANALALVASSPSSDESLDVESAEEALKSVEAQLVICERRHSDSQRQLSAVEGRLNDARTRAARSEGEHRQAEQGLGRASEALQVARELVSDDQVKEQLELSLVGLRTEKSVLTDLVNERNNLDPETVTVAIRNIDARLTRIGEEFERDRSRREQLTGELRASGSLDLQADVNKWKDEEATLSRQHADLERRARAAKLLFEVFSRHREEARMNRARPFSDEVNRLGKFVFGATTSFEVDPANFTVVARTSEGTTVPFEQLSTGTKEQVSVIAALACAILVNPAGVDGDAGAPVILDDVLGFTDPDRLKRLGPVFAEASKAAQIILLTASPDRYESIGEASFVRL